VFEHRAPGPDGNGVPLLSRLSRALSRVWYHRPILTTVAALQGCRDDAFDQGWHYRTEVLAAERTAGASVGEMVGTTATGVPLRLVRCA
jgi:hypothetical protein